MSKSTRREISFFTEEMYDDPKMTGLADFLDKVGPGRPWEIRTKTMLRLHGNSKRGQHVNTSIQNLLVARGLISTPGIEKADYYGTIVVSDPRDSLPERASVGALPISAFQGQDATLFSAGPEMAAQKVETLMVFHDFSQIPVLSRDQKNLYGVVTWRSLARFRADLSSATAKDVMETGFHVASSADDFLGLVDTIISKEFILYRNPEGAVTGIVTASDLAQAFNDASRVYIEIGEIEDRLRLLLDRAPLPDLANRLDPKFPRKDFRGATDMMFGEYINALTDEQIWKACGIQLDQGTFLKVLEVVKNARNDVMHFNSETPEETLVAVTQLLRALRSIPLQ